MGHQKITKPNRIAEQGKTQSSAQSTLPAVTTAEHMLYLQRSIGNQAVLRLLQPKLKTSQPGDRHEHEADRAAEKVVTPIRTLIVEDDAKDVRPGQLRKSEFLSELKTSVCSAAEEALSGTIWSAMGCPYIDRWFSHYDEQGSQHIERALRKYAPETASVRTAREYIPIVTQRVRRGIKQWAETGEVTGVPEEFAKGGMPGVTAGGLIGGLVGGALSAVGSAVSGLVSGVGRAVSGIGKALFKGREGGARRDGEDPQAIQSQLGSGHTLSGGMKSQMESAFGVDFSGVRIHTDSKATELSDRLNARAFTIGRDIAFGSGEYQPGTLIGDALLAHELAHVVQQGGGKGSGASMQKEDTTDNSLEEDADVSAMDAVVSVWGGVKGTLAPIGRNAMPELRSGLRLQRCAAASTQQRQTRTTTCSPIASDEWRRGVHAAEEMNDETAKRNAMVTLVRQALCPLNIEVAVAGNSSPDKVHPEDYRPVPIINFDINLNRKQSWPSRPAAPTRFLTTNYGYFFTRGSAVYAIIGPNSLNPQSPAYTRMAAEHELFHAQRHARRTEGDVEPELEAWTHDFVNYFHQLGRKVPPGVYLGASWTPLLEYYKRTSDEDARRTALEQLVNYYNNPPGSGAEQEEVRETFRLWLGRRDPSSLLIRHLKDRLRLGAP